MATTAGDIITASFIKCGVDSPTSAQTASALISLNNMVSSWGAESLMYAVVSESKAMTIGDSEYTIGSGGQWDTVRPIRIASCFLRHADHFDFPVRVLAGRDYNLMGNKSFSARPDMVYLLAEYPLAKLIFNAAPDYAYEMYCEFVKNFTEFALTSTTVTLPPEYKEALTLNLAVSLAEDWGRSIANSVIANAVRTKGIIEQMLASQKPVPKAKFDFYGMGSGGTDLGYNVATDDLIDGGVF